jgi:drug/metabolite transporter (DMT)-like permease
MSARAWLTFVTLGVVWGLPYLLIKIALGGIAALEVAWWELTIGAAVLLPLAAARGELAQVRQHWRPIGALALLQLAVPSSLIPISEQWIRSSLAGVLVATVPLLIALLGPLFGVRERFDVRRIAGLLMGFLGVVVLLGFDAPRSGVEWIGVACMLLAALAYALAPLVIQRFLHGAEGLGSSAVSLAIAALVLCPVGLRMLPSSLPSARAIACLIALGAVCTATGMLFYFFLIKEAGAARAGVVKYVSPVVAALLGAVVLGEAFPLSSVVGMILILSGSWFSTRVDARHRKNRSEEEGVGAGQSDKACLRTRSEMRGRCTSEPWQRQPLFR